MPVQLHSILLCASIALAGLGPASHARAEALRLDRKIALGDVAGRIDHMGFDPATGRLFVAELGNNSVGVIDVMAGSLIHRITGLSEPQGVGYAPGRDLLVVANGGTGEVVAYKTADFAVAWKILLGDDADNVRFEPTSGELFVGYGSALAVLDLDGRNIRTTRLAGHPEAFQLAGDRVFVNVPSARQIAAVDLRSGKVDAWPMTLAANFPMAIDENSNQIISVFRDPPRVVIVDAQTGRQRAALATCRDADDVWLDRKRHRVYVSCGDGHVAVISEEGASFKEVARVRTVEGARTSFFVPELDLLFVAARAHGAEKAALWVFRAGD